MFHKNESKKKIDIFPFKESQIIRFKNELEEAGGFDELMFKKLAYAEENGIPYPSKFENAEAYKKTFLTGVYEPLRDFYDGDSIPYTFWSDLYEKVQMWDNANKQKWDLH